MTPRDQRPAPPAGIKVLTVPEVVQLAQDRAAERGDGRARLMSQDIWRDIKVGNFKLGVDVFWVTGHAHPKGGYWVLTPEAVDRRIQQRLRGRGRPKQRRKEEEASPNAGDQAVRNTDSETATPPSEEKGMAAHPTILIRPEVTVPQAVDVDPATVVALPAIMCNEPPAEHWAPLIRPRVDAVLARLFPIVLRPDPPVEVATALKQADEAGLARLLLRDPISSQQFWAALRHGQPAIPHLMSLVMHLFNSPPAHLTAAGALEQEANRRVQAGVPLGEAGRAVNRFQWEQHRELVEQIHAVRGAVGRLLTREATAQAEADVTAEVQRLVALAYAESARSQRTPLEVVARWLKTGENFQSVELMRLVTFPLTKLLQGKAGEIERS